MNALNCRQPDVQASAASSCRQLLKAGCLCVAALLAAPALADEQLAAYSKELYDDSTLAIQKLEKQYSGGKLDKQSSLKIIRSHISPHVDFKAIARSAVGRHWKSATSDEKQQVTKEFRTLLENLFAVAMSKFSTEHIKLLPVSKQNDGTMLLPIRINKGGKIVEMDYIMALRLGKWQVVDLKIEGISLLSNYRRQFKSIIRSKGVKGLIAALQKKNQS